MWTKINDKFCKADSRLYIIVPLPLEVNLAIIFKLVHKYANFHKSIYIITFKIVQVFL